MGLFDDITGVLNNPAVQTLLPAALGAGAGALTAPRMGGTRGAVGAALGGAEQGLIQGQQVKNQAALASSLMGYRQLEGQKLTAALQTAQAHDAANQDLLTHMLGSPEGKRVLGSYGINTPDDIAGQRFDPKTMHDILTDYQKQTAPQTGLKQIIGPDGNPTWVKAADAVGQQAPQPTVLTMEGGTPVVTARSKAIGKEGVPPASITPKPETPEARAKTIAETDEAKARTEAIKKGKVSVVKGDDGYYHELHPDGSDVRSDVKVATPTKWELKPAGDGFYHRINAATGEDVKTDAAIVPKAPPKGQTPEQRIGTIASTIKKLTPTSYEVESVSNDDEVTLKYNGLIAYGHPDIKVKVPGAHELGGAHPVTGAGLPEGAADNGDGTWTLPDGTKVKPKSG